MKPPQLMRVGTKKTLWVNFQEICSMMKRPAEHVFQFFMAELGTEGEARSPLNYSCYLSH